MNFLGIIGPTFAPAIGTERTSRKVGATSEIRGTTAIAEGLASNKGNRCRAKRLRLHC
jgi:hypothetical protein